MWTSYEKDGDRTSDVDAPPHSLASDMDHELDESEALRKAARAGILLLEKNQELHDENEALRAQLAILESERPTLRAALGARDDEVAGLQDERKQCLVEINALRSELRAKSALVTNLLDSEQQLKSEVEESAAAKRLAEFQVESLQHELEALHLREGEKRRPGADSATTGGSNNSTERVPRRSVTNPAASYDSNQASVFTWADYEELMLKWQAAGAESEALQLELKSVRKEVEGLRKKAAKATEYYIQVEKLEKRNGKLQSANDTLNEELTEERALLESLRTMNLMYKQIADSRPFSFVDADGESATPPSAAQCLETHQLGISVQDVLLDTNMKLETELRELRDTLQLYEQLQSQPPGSNTVKLPASETNTPAATIDVSVAMDELKRRLSRMGSNNSEEYVVSCETASFSDFGSEMSNAAFDALVLKVQDLQEKLSVAKDMLKHTKLQWSAAVASQKALEECNRSAQAEITRLTQQLDYQVTSMANTASSSRTNGSAGLTRASATSGYDSDDEDKWVEETAPYPAPPGDLNSPLIKCLLDHWTTDKAKVMTLTDWLHHAIRGTGKPTPLRLHALTSEVAAGFAQLLVPIMREKHGVSVTIYRRDSVHVLSDLVLQTTQPSINVPSFSTTASASSVAVATAPLTSVPAASTASGGAEGEKPPVGESPEVQRPRSRFLKGEAQFLYG
ncbi:hypothetical protein PybrP1_006323 [[Pythium] brassicae (nom. inval.)]|nr:hypothetical protein PybrP1_006323 [[Pythium] brassicae (nom. inval.)]